MIRCGPVYGPRCRPLLLLGRRNQQDVSSTVLGCPLKKTNGKKKTFCKYAVLAGKGGKENGETEMKS